MARRVACAGAIVFDGRDRLLLIRRGHPPAAGSWSLPGGHCEPGETAADACVRETAEETGLRVEPVRHVGTVERPAPAGDVYVIDDFLCRWVEGEPVAGDDADDVRWATRAELAALELAPGVLDALNGWNLLPR